MEFPGEVLQKFATDFGVCVLSKEFAQQMDRRDPLREFRNRFCYPKKHQLSEVDKSLVSNPSEECVYLCGNSLGLKPKATDAHVIEQLDKWGKTGVEVHFDGALPAALCDLYGRESLARLVGAVDHTSVRLMNGLTVNLHLLLISFYQPTEQRFKILLTKHEFHSDRYAAQSQAALRGYDPEEAIIEVGPREGEDWIRTEDILKILEEEGQSIAVLCFSAVHFYTGQKFDVETITRAAHRQGAMVGWDLAHAIGNVEIKLDEWGVDFACWCTYKYLNSGAGCIAGAYVNPKHKDRETTTLTGWWSNRVESKFSFLHKCDLSSGVARFAISNPPPLLVACVMASLEIFDEARMERILGKQFLLTGYLELLILKQLENIRENGKEENQDERRGGNADEKPFVKMITPRDPKMRGTHLSIELCHGLDVIHEGITKRGMVVDIRRPNAIRIAPTPLYNSFLDVHVFVHTLRTVILDTIQKQL